MSIYDVATTDPNATRPVATFGGFTLLGSTNVSWKITSGISPYTTFLDMVPDDADKILQELVPRELRIGNLLVKNLYAIQEVAADVPAIARVMVVDRRWFWTFESDRIGYNIRRKTGFKSLETPNAISGARSIIPTIDYAPWSMNGQDAAKIPWNATTLLLDFKERLVQCEKLATGRTPTFQIMRGVTGGSQELPIENLWLSGDMATCLGQLLTYLPGVSVYVDRNGVIVFYKTSTGGEDNMVKALGAEKVNYGHIRPVKLGNIRPKQINVKFCREVELRFDYIESNQAAGATSAGSQDLRSMLNVMPIPDYSLRVGNATLPQGTWITIDQALTAWGACPLFRGARQLTPVDLQRAAVPWNDLLSAIDKFGVSDFSANWAARLSCALDHYRRTFQINKRWMDRIFRLEASRVGTLDFATASRGKSLIFSDFSQLYTTRSAFHDFSGNHAGRYVDNKAIFDGGSLRTTRPAAPGNVEVIDEDLGIIRFEFGGDVTQAYGMVFPSQIELNGDSTAPGTPSRFCPTGDFRLNTDDPRAFDILVDPDRWPKLTGAAKMATVISAQPGFGGFLHQDPTNTNLVGQFYVKKVLPNEVSAFAGQNKCNGPILEVIIDASYITALFPWLETSDQDKTVREAMFGLGVAPQDAVALNDSGTHSTLYEIAHAVAERLYHSLADRSLGSMGGTLVPDIEPSGWIDSVDHSLSTDGEFSTSLALPDRIQPLQLEAYLSAGVRALVMRLARSAP